MKYFSGLVLLLIMFVSLPSFSQSYLRQENAVWVMGGSGIDFSSGSPVQSPANSSATGLIWRLASVADKHGNLLFYADGDRVYGRDNFLMPNGFNINGAMIPGTFWSSFGYGLIVPMPDSAHKYYLFSYIENTNKIFYSVVNMKLNNGMGDVEPAQHGILLGSGYSGMTAMAGENCDFWLVTRQGNSFKLYNIGGTGINTSPVISSAGFSGIGMCVSPNRRKLAQLQYGGTLQFYDLDPATGIASNPLTVPAPSQAEVTDFVFSPDNSKLYIAGIPIIQYDINTQTATSLGGCARTLRLAPDGKIYVGGGCYSPYLNSNDPLIATNGNGSAGRIEFPDLPGTACQYSLFPGGYLPFLGSGNGIATVIFPAEIPLTNYKDTLGSHKSLNLCFNAPDTLLIPQDTNGHDYLWSDNSGEKLKTVSSAGLYTVTYFTYNPCAMHRDSFLVARTDFSFSLGPDTVLCNQDPYLLNPAVGQVAYLWQDGSTAPVFNVTGSGAYWAKLTRDGCSRSDSVSVRFTDLTQDLGPDMKLCKGDPLNILLKGNVPAFASALWSDGSSDKTLNATGPGSYWIRVTDKPCQSSDTLTIGTEVCSCITSVPSVFSPNGDGRNDLFRPVINQDCLVKGYSLSIYNRWGQRVFYASNPMQGWDGSQQGTAADAGTYMYTLELETGTKNEKFRQNGDLILVR